MFDQSTPIKRALARVGLALNRTLVATQRERDQAIQERDQAVAERKAVEGGEFDKFPAALIAAEAERDAFRTQRLPVRLRSGLGIRGPWACLEQIRPIATRIV
jgi:hypothetical protein